MTWYILSGVIFLLAMVLLAYIRIKESRYMKKKVSEVMRKDVREELDEEIREIHDKSMRFKRMLSRAMEKK